MNKKPHTTTPESSPKAAAAEEQIRALADEAAHWKDLALRGQADMENLRKRTQLEIEKANKYATAGFAKGVLAVADSLRQALACARQEQEPNAAFLKNLLQGIEMTQAQLNELLKANGIEKMEGLGKVFDPHLHKVIQEVADNAHPKGTILQELQAGYTIGGDRVLREALVVVSK